MYEIFKSLLLICSISGIISYIGYYYYNIEYTGTFILICIIQLALSWYIKTYIQFKREKITVEMQTAMLDQIENESTQAPCAYCGEVNMIPISPVDDNDFECINCEKKNSVYVNITVAQQTVPVSSEPYEVTNYNSNLAHAKASILND